jgi:hypothetical protein
MCCPKGRPRDDAEAGTPGLRSVISSYIHSTGVQLVLYRWRFQSIFTKVGTYHNPSAGCLYAAIYHPISTRDEETSCPKVKGTKAKVRPPRNTTIPSPNSTKHLSQATRTTTACSARGTSGSPTPPPQPINLRNAINEAPAAGLKMLMQRLSANISEARTFIEATLLRPLVDNNSGESSSSSTGGLKRKATEECKNCGEFYQIDDNKKRICRYHPGKFLSRASIFEWHGWSSLLSDKPALFRFSLSHPFSGLVAFRLPFYPHSPW